MGPNRVTLAVTGVRRAADLASLIVQPDRYHEARDVDQGLAQARCLGNREHGARDDVILARLRARIGPLARGEGEQANPGRTRRTWS